MKLNLDSQYKHNLNQTHASYITALEMFGLKGRILIQLTTPTTTFLQAYVKGSAPPFKYLNPLRLHGYFPSF